MAKTSTFVLTEDEQRTLRIEDRLRKLDYTGILLIDYVPDLRNVRYYVARNNEGETVMLAVIEDHDSKDLFNVTVYTLTGAFVLVI